MNLFRALSLFTAIFVASPAWAVLPTFYVDTAGNGGVTTDSGTTDSANTALATCTGGTTWLSTTGCKGTGANWTTGTATINLDTNTNLQSPFPTDGSQFIFLTNATNSNQKVFSVTGITGCTGTGACSVTTSINVTCATCTAQNWAIGGRITLPDTSIEAGLLPGSTIIVNTTLPSCGAAAACLTIRAAGDLTSGPITLQGKTSGYQTLTNTGNASAINNSTNSNNWVVTGLTITTVGTSATINAGSGGGFIIKNNKINCNTSSGVCITGTGSFSVLDNALTSSGGTGAGVSASGGVNQIIGNYIHAVGGDCIVESNVAPQDQILDNILSGCGGWGINLSGATATFVGATLVEGNTLYNNTSGNLTVANKQTIVRMRNNILELNQASGTNVSYPAVSGITDVSTLAGGSHNYNDFYVTGGATNFANFAASSTDITTDPAFTNAAGGDFSITTSSGAYGTGGNNALLNASTTSFRSMGVMQLTGQAITLNAGIIH